MHACKCLFMHVYVRMYISIYIYYICKLVLSILVHKLIILLPDQLVQKAVNAYLKEKNELDMLRPGNSFNLGESTEVTDDNNSPKPFIEVQPSSTTDVSLADKSMDSIPVPPSKVDSDKDTCDETRSADDTPTPAMGEPIEKQESVIMSGGQFSPLASLGQVAECAMLNGQAVDDVTIVDIILHELKYLYMHEHIMYVCVWIMSVV